MNIDLIWFQEIIYKWLITSGTKIILILFIVLFAKKVVALACKKLLKLHLQENEGLEYGKKLQTVYAIIKSLLDFIIIAIAGMLILGELGINLGPILAAAGVLGVAVGFGSQRLIEDIISGFIILINDQIRVGDVVEIDGKSGYVEKLDLKMVVLRDLSGNVHFLRNGKIDVVTNMTKDYSYALFEIGIAYKESVEKVMEVMKQIYEEIKQNPFFEQDILEPIEIFGLDKFDDSAVIVKARIKTKPIKQWAITREFNLKLKNKFDDLGIEIPFPQRTIHISKSSIKETDLVKRSVSL